MTATEPVVSKPAKSLRSYAGLFRFLGWTTLILCVGATFSALGSDEPSGMFVFALLVSGVAALLSLLWGAALSDGVAELLERGS